MSKVLLIDNYDSFTYNLFHYLDELNGGHVTVIRNDSLNLTTAQFYDRIVLSPGPGLPRNAGKLMEIISEFAQWKPILGICLGQQAIAEHFGMRLENLRNVVHGQSKKIRVLNNKSGLFKGLPTSFLVGRYHSWVIEKNSITQEFEITSVDDENNIMSIQHVNLPIAAVQFHPESILSQFGKEILENWLKQ